MAAVVSVAAPRLVGTCATPRFAVLAVPPVTVATHEQRRAPQEEAPSSAPSSAAISNDDNNNNDTPLDLPTPIALTDLLRPSSSDADSCSRPTAATVLSARLRHDLVTYGFCLLDCPTASRPGRIVTALQDSLTTDLFPCDCNKDEDPSDPDNHANPAHTHLSTSDTVYVSERGVPMYKLGYEATADGVREIFRIAAGAPDAVDFCDNGNTNGRSATEVRTTWLRALALLRQITDVTLDLLLMDPDANSDTNNERPSRRRQRPYAGAAAWQRPAYARDIGVGHLRDRPDDYSVLYAMHYFNRPEGHVHTDDDDDELLAVKAHVDPSLCVIEPFTSVKRRGLQVWHMPSQTWLDCDGPQSPLTRLLVESTDTSTSNRHLMVLFAGKALAEVAHLPTATRHRVVHDVSGSRRAVIYEQKYGEFFV
jgi:hypothetical protein